MAFTINKFELLPCQKEKIEIIIAHLKERKNLHIYGAEGTSKSFLLDWIHDNLKEIDNSLVLIYCRSSRTLREILLRISGFLLNHFKHLESIDKFTRVKEIKCPSDIKKLNIRTLRDIIFSYMLQDDFCVILDHLEYVTPKINSFLSTFYEKALVISASRQSWEITDYSFRGRLDYCLYLVPKLRIENLTKKDAFIFMANLYNNLGIRISNKIEMFEEVFHVTEGNPKMIGEIFRKAQKPEYFKGNMLNLNLILIDCRIDRITK